MKALRIKQKPVKQGGTTDLYLTALTAKMLLDMAEVDTWREDNPEGYQRPLVSGRLKDVAHYVVNEEGVLPTSILVCVRDENDMVFEPEETLGGIGELGSLDFKEGAKIWVIDGQHRLFGIKQAIEAGNSELEGYPIPVSMFGGIDKFHEMRHFYLVNTRQKGVPTDVVDLHLAQMREELGVEMRELTGRLATIQEREYRRARAVKITRILRETDGPWKGAIRLPGEKLTSNHQQRLHAVVSSLVPVMRDQYTGAIPDEDLAKLVANYWISISNVWPGAFERSEEYQVFRTPGLYSLHMVFPDVIARCRDARDFSQEKMKEVISSTGVDTEFWHKVRGNRMVIGTGMGSIRTLAQYIREKLPRLVLPGLIQTA